MVRSLTQQVGHHCVPVLGIVDGAQHARVLGKGEAVVEGVGHPRQLHIEGKRVYRLAVLVLLAQLLEVVGIDVIKPVALVAQVDATEITLAEFLGALEQAPGDIKSVEIAFVGVADVEGQFLFRIVPGLCDLNIDAVVGRIEVLEFDA